MTEAGRQDYFLQGTRGWLRLHEKGGKRHDVPAHHRAEAAVDAYLVAGGIEDAKARRCFQSVDRSVADASRGVLAMIKRRAAAAGLPASTCCHTFRATASRHRRLAARLAGGVMVADRGGLVEGASVTRRRRRRSSTCHIPAPSSPNPASTTASSTPSIQRTSRSSTASSPTSTAASSASSGSILHATSRREWRDVVVTEAVADRDEPSRRVILGNSRCCSSPGSMTGVRNLNQTGVLLRRGRAVSHARSHAWPRLTERGRAYRCRAGALTCALWAVSSVSTLAESFPNW